MTHFRQRRLRVRFELSQGSFSAVPDDNIIEIDGLRISAQITHVPSYLGSQAVLAIFGLSSETMDALTILTGVYPMEYVQNRVFLYSIEDDQPVLVFQGHVYQAVADYNASPSVALHVYAQTIFGLQTAAIGPLTFSGANGTGDILRGILGKCNEYIEDENRHYNVEIRSEHLPVLPDISLQGDAWSMIATVCEQAGALYWLDGTTLIVTKIQDIEDDEETIPLSSETGMIGYPVLTAVGCNVKAVFSTKFRLLSYIRLSSTRVRFRGAELQRDENGRAYYRSEAVFRVMGLVSRLDSEMPSGVWQSEMQLIYRI